MGPNHLNSLDTTFQPYIYSSIGYVPTFQVNNMTPMAISKLLISSQRKQLFIPNIVIVQLTPEVIAMVHWLLKISSCDTHRVHHCNDVIMVVKPVVQGVTLLLISVSIYINQLLVTSVLSECPSLSFLTYRMFGS